MVIAQRVAMIALVHRHLAFIARQDRQKLFFSQYAVGGIRYDDGGIAVSFEKLMECLIDCFPAIEQAGEAAELPGRGMFEDL